MNLHFMNHKQICLLGQVGKVTRGLMIGKRLLCLSDVTFCIEHGVGERL